MRSREMPLWLILFLVCVALCLLYNVTDFDIWARLAVGKLFFELGHVSPRDIFAYTPTKPLWVDHEWGSGVVFFLTADACGQKGLLGLRLLCYFGTIVLVHLVIRERMEKPTSLLFHLVLAKALLFGFAVTVRSQVFTYLFFSLWFYLLERARRGKSRALLLLPVSMVVWANLHGGFLSGLGLLLIYGTGEFLNRRPWKIYGLLFVLCSLATLLNPYGVAYWRYLHEAVLLPRILISEWRPTDFCSPIRLVFEFKILFLLTLLLLAGSAVARRKQDWTQVILLLVTGYLAVRHVRHTTFFDISCAPFLYGHLRRGWRFWAGRAETWFPTAPRQKFESIAARGQAVLHGLLVAALALVMISLPVRVDIPESDLPVGAVRFIRQNHLQGNLLLPFTWGNFAIWELYPACRVASDGRYEEVYAEGTFRDIHRFVAGRRGWEQVLNKYPHELILIPRASRISPAMKDQRNWALVYQDDFSELYLPAAHPRREWVLPDRGSDRDDPFSTQGLDRVLPACPPRSGGTGFPNRDSRRRG